MAEHHSSRATSGMSGKKSSKSGGKKSSHKPHSIHVRRGKSGGFVAEHHFKNDSPDQMAPESEEHVLPDMAALQDHMAQNMGDQGPAPAAPPAPDPSQTAQAGPPPAAAGPAPAPQPGM